MTLRLKIIGLGVAAFVAATVSSYAQTDSPQSAALEQEDFSTVFAFNRICYAQVPNVGAIGQMAQDLVWQAMEKADLSAFETGGQLDTLDGWDAQIGERIYRVGISQGPVLDSQIETFPDFKSGTTTTCTFVLDGLDDEVELMAEMQALAGKQPISKNVLNGALSATTWAGGNDDIKVFLIASLGGEKGGLLSVTVLTK